MISSPCKNCPNRHLPKDICSKNCKLLHSVQEFQISSRESGDSPAIDYCEETRFSIRLSPQQIFGTF